MKLTKEFLTEFLSYDEITGDLTWNPRGIKDWDTKYAGKVAGHVRKDGYRALSLFGKSYLVHLIIWVIMTGELPKEELDHKDRNKNNNSFENLREADRSLNNKNRGVRKDNLSGYTGVSYVKSRNKWRVRIANGAKEIALGMYNSFEEAVQIRKKAEVDYGYT